ncbi:hypothetical protein HDU99_007070 [Rhizoclosmatium hyalinum]|nr:hypothetical protein HDU99_007070 [Rhizoclosmatium hyalinum]
MLRTLAVMQDYDSTYRSNLAFGLSCDADVSEARSGVSFFGKFMTFIGMKKPAPSRRQRLGLTVSFCAEAVECDVKNKKSLQSPTKVKGRPLELLEQYCDLMYGREMGTLRPGSNREKALDEFELKHFGGSKLSKAQTLRGLERWRAREDLSVTSDVYFSALEDVQRRSYSVRWGPADFNAIEYEMGWTEPRFRAFLERKFLDAAREKAMKEARERGDIFSVIV